MHVAWIEVRDFRNHADVRLELSPGLTAVVGPNGRGKTNLLEAIYYLCWLVSPRVSSDLPLVRSGATSAYLRGEVQGERGRFLVEVEVRSSGQNRIQMNRSPVRRKRDVRRDVRAVFCGPDDLAVVLGDPSERRRFMDEVVTSLRPAKDGATAGYDRVLRQRNPYAEPIQVSDELFNQLYDEMATDNVSGWDYNVYASPAYFIKILRRHTFTGAFSHPKYGGNSGAAGWAYLSERMRDPQTGRTLFDWPRITEKPLGESPDYHG